MPGMGYITHTVSAPSLHGKTVRSSLLDVLHNFIFFIQDVFHVGLI